MCREVLWEEGQDGRPVVTGLRLTRAGQEQVVTADAYVAALDVPGAQRLIPENWRRFSLFDNIYKLVGVPVITVQLRYHPLSQHTSSFACLPPLLAPSALEQSSLRK